MSDVIDGRRDLRPWAVGALGFAALLFGAWRLVRALLPDGPGDAEVSLVHPGLLALQGALAVLAAAACWWLALAVADARPRRGVALALGLAALLLAGSLALFAVPRLDTVAGYDR